MVVPEQEHATLAHCFQSIWTKKKKKKEINEIEGKTAETSCFKSSANLDIFQRGHTREETAVGH